MKFKYVSESTFLKGKKHGLEFRIERKIVRFNMYENGEIQKVFTIKKSKRKEFKDNFVKKQEIDPKFLSLC